MTKVGDGGASISRKRRWFDAVAWLALALLILTTIAHLLTKPPAMPGYEEVRKSWQPSEAWLYDREGRLLDSERIDFERRRMAWVPLADIAQPVRTAVVVSEDKRYWSHGGVDWLAIASAAKTRWTGGRSRGASTLPMQLAAFLSPEIALPGQRGWLNKIRQMRAAQALASDWSRDEMLEAYFNLVPLRGETQGIGAGARALFGKKPADMDRTDAALFAGLLPNPAAGAETLGIRACRVAQGSGAATKDCGPIRAAAATLVSGERIAQLDPSLAPHLAVRLLDRPGKRVVTTIDRRIQEAAIVALKRQLAGLGATRVRDGAVVVLDNRTGDVLAYVGGVGLKSTAAAVDGANARRQAGSTLKPHLYAQVIEHRWLTAASILDDSPVQLDTASGLYVPKNYDRSFKGPVSVRHALASSLNVPAVRTLVIDDVQQFRDRLWALGYHGLVEDGEYYGFSLALGSAEVSLVEQANAFRTLANQGKWSPVRFDAARQLRQHPRAVVDPAAAFIVGDILADASARTDAFGADSALRLPFWAAAKTGTSKGMRDNWCIGWSDRFTVAVWVGNLEGDSMRAVSGTSGAAPVWRDVMMALHAGSPGKPPAMPAGVEARRIALPGTREPPRREYFMAGTAQSEMAAAPQAARRPRITSPVSGSVYALDPDIPLDRQRLAVAVSGEVEGFRLILDKKPLGDADAGQQILPRPGSHMLALVDPGGRMVDRVRFTVR